jgi:hypothetical protein
VGLLQRKRPEDAAAVLAPKVAGTLALEAALDAEAPEAEVVVLFSSVTSITGGGPGQADYCAANAFLDAFATARAAAPHPRRRTVSVSWGEWQWDAWEAGLEGFPPEVRDRLVEHRRRYGIHAHEGVEALRRALARNLAHVYVTTEDLAGVIRISRKYSATFALEQLRAERELRPRHPRPPLSTSYVEPRNQAESTIAGIWASVLGLDMVGIDDNFFELGGNSLIGIDAVGQVRTALTLDTLAATVVYAAPTVRAMAEHVGRAAGDRQAPEVDESVARGQRRRETLRHMRQRSV